MRLWLLSVAVPMLVLGAGNPVAAQARDGARFEGVGSGITHAPGDKPLSFVATTGSQDRPARAGASADRPGPAPAAAPRGPGGFDYRGLRMTPSGLESIRRDSLPGGGASLLPPDLRSMPQPSEKTVFSGSASPRLSVRENGAVLGLSYKIKPVQQ